MMVLQGRLAPQALLVVTAMMALQALQDLRVQRAIQAQLAQLAPLVPQAAPVQPAPQALKAYLARQVRWDHKARLGLPVQWGLWGHKVPLARRCRKVCKV